MEHDLLMESYHDVQAKCSCGRWSYSYPGKLRYSEVKREHDKHKIYYESRENKGQEAAKKEKPKWTVILLYPDYATGDFGADIFAGWASCNDPHKAVAIVQKSAWEANGGRKGSINAPEDMRPIAVLKGHQTLELDATCFQERG
jgi:hypothetical protein